MAENEILDVGSKRRYRKWKAALANPELTASEVAECLSQEMTLLLKSRLRGKPLYLILKACGKDKETLQQAIANVRDRGLAKFVEDAYAITRSNDIHVIARKIADLIADGLLDRSSLYAGKHDHHADSSRHAALEREASARLESCKPEIISLLVASLSAQPIKRGRSTPRARPTAQSMVLTSLRPIPR